MVMLNILLGQLGDVQTSLGPHVGPSLLPLTPRGLGVHRLVVGHDVAWLVERGGYRGRYF